MKNLTKTLLLTATLASASSFAEAINMDEYDLLADVTNGAVSDFHTKGIEVLKHEEKLQVLGGITLTQTPSMDVTTRDNYGMRQTRKIFYELVLNSDENNIRKAFVKEHGDAKKGYNIATTQNYMDFKFFTRLNPQYEKVGFYVVENYKMPINSSARLSIQVVTLDSRNRAIRTHGGNVLANKLLDAYQAEIKRLVNNSQSAGNKYMQSTTTATSSNPNINKPTKVTTSAIGYGNPYYTQSNQKQPVVTAFPYNPNASPNANGKDYSHILKNIYNKPFSNPFIKFGNNNKLIKTGWGY